MAWGSGVLRLRAGECQEETFCHRGGGRRGQRYSAEGESGREPEWLREKEELDEVWEEE